MIRKRHPLLQPTSTIHSLQYCFRLILIIQKGSRSNDDRQQKKMQLTAAASISQPIMNIATARITNPTCEAIYRREISYVHIDLKAPFEKQQQGSSP